MKTQLLGRPLQFGDAEQIAAIRKMEKERMSSTKRYAVTVKYAEIVEIKRTSVFEIRAETAAHAEKEAVDKLIDRYKKQKSIDIDFLDIVVTERADQTVPDPQTMELFSNGSKI